MYGGSYFQQNLAVYNGEIEKRMAFSNPDRKFDYRFLCQLTDGSFAVIEIRGQGYLKALQQLCSIEKYRVKMRYTLIWVLGAMDIIVQMMDFMMCLPASL